jgi:hypothetical protein
MRVKSVRRQQSALKKCVSHAIPSPYTGDGFVIETAASGKLSVYFKEAVVEWHKPVCTEVEDILEQCAEMAALQAELMQVWDKINRVGIANGFQLTDAFCARGLFPTMLTRSYS